MRTFVNLLLLLVILGCVTPVIFTIFLAGWSELCQHGYDTWAYVLPLLTLVGIILFGKLLYKLIDYTTRTLFG